MKTTPVMSSTGPVGRWLSGNPLRGGEGERGPAVTGQIDIGVVELAGRVGKVGSDLDGRFLGVRGSE